MGRKKVIILPFPEPNQELNREPAAEAKTFVRQRVSTVAEEGRYSQLEDRLRQMVRSVPRELLLRLAFVDEREPSYLREPDCLAVFHVGPRDGPLPLGSDLLWTRIEIRLLWAATAALICGTQPASYGVANPVPIRPVLLPAEILPDGRVASATNFSRALSFAGRREWSRLLCSRGFTTGSSVCFLPVVERKPLDTLLTEARLGSEYGLHDAASFVLTVTCASLNAAGSVGDAPKC